MINLFKNIILISLFALIPRLGRTTVLPNYDFRFNERDIAIHIIRSKTFLLNDSAIVGKIMDKIFKLPEVQAKDKYINSITHGKHGVSMIVRSKPQHTDKFYWIAVGYNGDQRFETYFNFYVWPDTMEIKFYDTQDGKILSLKAWRKKSRP